MNFDRINTITETRTMDWNENPLPIDEYLQKKRIRGILKNPPITPKPFLN